MFVFGMDTFAETTPKKKANNRMHSDKLESCAGSLYSYISPVKRGAKETNFRPIDQSTFS